MAEPASPGAPGGDPGRADAEETRVFGVAEEERARGGLRSLVDELFFAGLGAVALTKERVDELVDDLAGRGTLTREEARGVVEDAAARWRGDAARLGERASASLAGTLRELGLVTRHEWEELELRLAQVEHRLRLVEDAERHAPEGGMPPPGGVRRRRP